MEEQIAEETRHLQHFQADHQRLIGDSKESEIVIQSAEQVIATAQATIAKAEALIKINEQKLAAARKKLEELEAAKTRLKKTSPLIPPSWNLYERSWLRRNSYLRRCCGSKLSWRLRKRVSTRCIASENKSVLWRIKIISLLPFFVCKKRNTLFVRSVCNTFIIFGSNNKSLQNFAPSSLFHCR